MNVKAIVTAGAAGIGLAIARRLVADGGAVAICDVDATALDQAAADLALASAEVADVTHADAMQDFVDRAVLAMDGLDLVVANAGIGGPTAFLEDVSHSEWSATLAVNLDGQFNLLRAAIPHLKRRSAGSVVLMSSAAGRLGYPMRAPYAVAKWGVVGLKETLAMELGPHGISVNAILPGSVAGARMDRVLADKAAATGITRDRAQAEEVANVSMRRMVAADEIAGVVAFLASLAGRSISGQSIGVCGNFETLR